MTRQRGPAVGLAGRLVLISLSGAVMIGFVLGMSRTLERRAQAAAETGESRQAAEPVVIAAATAPIAAEALPFLARGGPPGGDDAAGRRPAHPRTLATFRALRAFPGAPPRIPHGLTADEFRTGACGTCHERGGFSPRFGAYVPVTPHPELADCLQCHTADDAVVGAPLPADGPNGVCLQCHAPARAAVRGPSVDWRPAGWPALAARGSEPPPIPHDLTLRGSCNACHAGPAAVAELRTTHPERTDCRQCHLLAAPDVPPFRRGTIADDQPGGDR